jgi:hypothetical protein
MRLVRGGCRRVSDAGGGDSGAGRAAVSAEFSRAAGRGGVFLE